MDIYKTIISKRDTRDYKTRPITDESLHRILQAGRMAGSSRNAQPLRFIVMRDREAIAALAQCGRSTTPLIAAPLVIVILLQKGERPFDAGRAGQNMMIAAWAEGIASRPVGIQQSECGIAALGAPETYEVAMALAFGYPKAGAPLSRGEKRRPLEDIVHWDHWDSARNDS